MPITSSAKKALRQANKRQEVRKPFKTELKTMVKKIITLSKTDKEAAKKALPQAFSAVDKAAKKNIIHKNTAGRKKARLSKLVNDKK